MTKNYLRPPAYQQFAWCFRAPVGFAFGMFAAASILARAASSRRTQIPRRGTAVKSSRRSKIVVALLAVLGVVALVAMLATRGQGSADQPGTPNSVVTTLPGEAPQPLEGWRRPMTTDPRVFAIAYARAI